MSVNNITHKGKPLVWPIPNECCWEEGELELPSDFTMSCHSEFSNERGLFLSALATEGISVAPVEDKALVRIYRVNDVRINDEGYILDVKPDGITLEANTPKGAFYGFQTLLQLIANSEERRIPSVTIMDSPFKPVRGLHFYVPPRKDLAWFKKFTDFIAKYKYNTIFLEMGASMKFDTHPEINTAWETFCKEMLTYPGGPDGNYWGDDGMQMRTGHIKNSVHIENGGGSYLEKWELAELVEYAKRRHIDIIPEVQTLSHSYWLLLAHRECAERADDPYPDTYCPSNPATYEILFDCMQEIIDVIKPGTVSIGHDELHWKGICDKCKDRTGHDLLADDINTLYVWLKERGLKTFVWGDKFLDILKIDEREIGMPVGGGEYILFNQRTRQPEVCKATCRAIDMIPSDIIIGDWYYTMTAGEDTASQDHFGQRGMQVVFGNFNPTGFPNVEDRLRRPNVTGAEVSLWHETSEWGMALTDGLVRYLDCINLLWYKGYKNRLRGEFNKLIAQLYPLERGKMNGREACGEKAYEPIDISRYYNAPLNSIKDYSFITYTEPLPNTVPFKLCKSVENKDEDLACMITGHGNPHSIRGIPVKNRFQSLVFLHSYTVHLGGPPAHACSYVGPEKDRVGCYLVEYTDGSLEQVPLEYSRNIYRLESEFGSHNANPVYQRNVLTEVITKGVTSKKLTCKAANDVVFGYEWINPYPDKEIATVSVEHDPGKNGGIVVFGVTGCR
jgi:Glycosyl hydrolase family 20, domain 2/Glycosyl hydrolase family 20, catalytic domain